MTLVELLVDRMKGLREMMMKAQDERHSQQLTDQMVEGKTLAGLMAKQGIISQADLKRIEDAYWGR